MQKMQKSLQTARTLCILFIVQNCLLFLIGVTTLLGQSNICGDVPGSEPISAIFCVRMLNKAVMITAMAFLYVIGGAVTMIVLIIPYRESSKIKQAVPQSSTLKALAWVLATTFSSLLLFIDGGMQNTIIQRKQLLISYIWLSAMASYFSLIAVQIYVYIQTIRKHPDEAPEDCEVVV